MAGFYDNIGVYRTFMYGNTMTPPESEITQAGAQAAEASADKFFGYANNVFEWLGKILKNWQLLIIGAIACLILWKRL